MIINASTKIATLLKYNPAALDAITRISNKFTKLRNPLLRKLLAGRTSIWMAAKIGGCSLDEFYKNLEPLGFEIDKSLTGKNMNDGIQNAGFMKGLDPSRMVDLDVRPLMESGSDPLKIILEKINNLREGEVLNVINSFTPTPLIHLLQKKGYEVSTQEINPGIIHTYFFKPGKENENESIKQQDTTENWDQIWDRFKDNMLTIDVRSLEMPGPMHMILEELDKLEKGRALHILHKRIPVFLLPELEEQGFNYRIKEISDTEVQLLIYKI